MQLIVSLLLLTLQLEVRNIFPDPNKSPTIFIPSINGPSIISKGFFNFIS